MALLRRGTKDTVQVDDPADDVYVVSPKAAHHAVKAEKETRRAAKADRKLAQAERKALERSGSAQSSGKAATGSKGADSDDESAAADPITGAKVKRYLGIARILVPVLAPLAYQAASTARARWDTHRARQLGVAPDELADFTGRGAGLYARIHNVSLSTRDLRTRRGTGDHAADVRAFADDAENRLSDLEAAVRAAEQMPTARRRSAHTAVAAELDRIETRLLVQWGVDGGRRTTAVEGPGRPQDS